MEEQENLPVLLDVVSNNIAKIAERFAITQHDLTVQQFKVWIVFVATLDQNDDGSNIYQFNAIDLAKRMNIDERKARGTIVAKLFEQLSDKQIKYYSEENSKGEQHVFSAHLVSSVVYNRDTHILQLEIPTVIRPLLFALKQGTFVNIDTRDIVALDTIFPIRIYIYLKNLVRKGIFSVELEEFKHNINATAESYKAFKELKRLVIKPAVKEIRKHTEYKDFFIEDNGGRGVKATHLRFGFEKTLDNDIFADVTPNRATICRRFPDNVQIVMRLAMDHGFDPLYIEDKLDDIPSDRIIANFRYVMNEIIAKDKRRGTDKGPEVYGKYFIVAVKEAWAEKNGKEDEMLLRDRDSQKNRKIQSQMKEAQENDDAANEAIYRKNMSKLYLERLIGNFTELDSFIKKNLSTLKAMSTRGDFDISKAMSGKKTYKEYRVMLQLVEAKILTNEIRIPKQESLFF